MKKNVVDVFLWGQEICRLEWRGGYKPHFGKLGAIVSFSPAYASQPWDLDPLGFYNKSVYLVNQGLSDWCRAEDYEGIPRFISGSLPDEWGNAVFSAWVSDNHLKHSEISAVDKLAFIGSRGMGALEFVPSLYKATDRDLFVLEDLYRVSRAIQEQREHFSVNLEEKPGIGDLMTVGMSAGGMHPKAIVAINWETGEVRSGQVPLPEGFTHYILKFKDSDSWPTAEIEYAYYQMATACGITMEPSRLLEIDSDQHFLTRRFDRKNGQKIHTATLNALCGSVYAYEEVFKAARSLSLGQPEINQLFRRVVFNYLAGVCDDHDKNISFMMDQQGVWHLSPAYDLTFTVNFKNPFIGDRHAMTLMGKDRFVGRDDFLRLAEDNDIRGAGSIIQEIAEIISAFSDYAEHLSIDKNITEAIQRYIATQK